ncbi:MAG: helix-turn-helix transcriptional regulator [Polaromonas sp.]
MKHLTRNDFASALQLLAQIEAQADDARSFAQAVALALNDFVASDLTTLSVRDLITGHHQVVGLQGGLPTHRMADQVSRHDGQRSAPHGDGCWRIGLAYTIAVPLYLDRRTLVSVVLERRGFDFDERDRARLDLLRPHLAFLYRHACHAGHALAATGWGMPLPTDFSAPGLTLREADVMHWLACGKTDAEIAVLLTISRRTVQKHLEHIYVKLGVETRTAAVMRALAAMNSAALH